MKQVRNNVFINSEFEDAKKLYSRSRSNKETLMKKIIYVLLELLFNNNNNNKHD